MTRLQPDVGGIDKRNGHSVIEHEATALYLSPVMLGCDRVTKLVKRNGEHEHQRDDDDTQA